MFLPLAHRYHRARNPRREGDLWEDLLHSFVSFDNLFRRLRVGTKKHIPTM